MNMKRMQLGLAGGLIPRDPASLTPAVARRIAALGVQAVVAHFQPPPEALLGETAQRVRAVLEDAGLSLSQVTGYNPNLVHPADHVRESGLERLRLAIAAAADLGAEMVITGCGSLHPTAFYGPAAGNHRTETRARLVESLRRAADWARDAGVVVAMECHVLTTLDTPAHIREVLDAVDSPWIVANFDPVNLIGDLPTLYSNGAAIRRMWDTGGTRWTRRSMHVKDIAPQPELVLHLAEAPPGQGLLDYAALCAICHHLDDGAALIVEHLDARLVPPALEFVRRTGEQHGLMFG